MKRYVLIKMFLNNYGNSASDDNCVIFSQERPYFNNPNKKIKIYSNFDDSIIFNESTLKELSEFYCENNEYYDNNVIKIKPEEIKKFLDIGSIIVLAKKNNKIISSMISLLLPTRLNKDVKIIDLIDKSERYNRILKHKKDDKDLIMPHTSYLNSHKKYRGKGLAGMVIQRGLQYNYDFGSLSAYFLNSVPRSDSAIRINVWTYPTNIKRLNSLNITYNKKIDKKILSRNHKTILVTEKNAELALNIYLNLVNNKTFYFNPDIEYWLKFIKSFDTYITNLDGKNIGIFTIFKHTVYVKDKKCNINYGNKIICVGKQSETLNAMIYQAQENSYDIIHLQEVGDLNYKLLSQINAIKTHNKDYLNYYNLRISLSPSDIYIPTL